MVHDINTLQCPCQYIGSANIFLRVLLTVIPSPIYTCRLNVLNQTRAKIWGLTDQFIMCCVNVVRPLWNIYRLWGLCLCYAGTHKTCKQYTIDVIESLRRLTGMTIFSILQFTKVRFKVVSDLAKEDKFSWHKLSRLTRQAHLIMWSSLLIILYGNLSVRYWSQIVYFQIQFHNILSRKNHL